MHTTEPLTARTDKALFGEPLVRIEHRIARNPKLLGERTSGDELTAVPNVAVENSSAQTFVEQVLLRKLASAQLLREVRHQQAVVQIFVAPDFCGLVELTMVPQIS
jgi:hypothetical protein